MSLPCYGFVLHSVMLPSVERHLGALLEGVGLLLSFCFRSDQSRIMQTFVLHRLMRCNESRRRLVEEHGPEIVLTSSDHCYGLSDAKLRSNEHVGSKTASVRIAQGT